MSMKRNGSSEDFDKKVKATPEYVQGYMAWQEHTPRLMCTDPAKVADHCPYPVGSGDRRTRWWDGWYSRRIEEFTARMTEKYGVKT